MSRNGAGVYSKPAGTTPVDGDTVLAAPFNLLMDDVAADLNLARPIAVGGTGASTAGAALTNFGLSADGQALVTAADYAAMLTALDLVKQTSATDTTTGSLLTVSAFGLGAEEPTTIANLDDETVANGFYRWVPAGSGTPPGGAAGNLAIIVLRDNAVNVQQIASRGGGKEIWLREWRTSSWTAWRSIIDSEDVSADTDFTVDTAKVPTRAAVKTAIDAVTPVLRTAVSTTSGTGAGFLSIPAGVNRIDFVLSGVSLSGTDNFIIQIGDAGGYEVTGYTSAGSYNGAGVTATNGFVIRCGSAPYLISGVYSFVRLTGNAWAGGWCGASDSASYMSGGGSKTLSAELDRIRILPTGSDTFDAGEVNVFYM